MGGPHGSDPGSSTSVTRTIDGLRKTTPYWYEFQTYSKLRWFGRELIEIMTTEFRDRTKEYYVWAIHKGICTVNGRKASIHQIIGDGDKICNSVHRHEPPVTDEPIKIIHRDDEEGILVIVKPGSIPVHAAGRYLRHTLTDLLRTEHGIEMVYTTNRLDRLTSGIMVCSTKKEMASRLGAQFAAGQVSKAYVCRVRGEFPQGEIVCKEPILTIDRQSGVNIVHPKGKYCETIFVRLSYHPATNSSVVFCRPITGRTHQIRVHVQWLGHPICNDPIYGHDVWSKVDPSSFAKVIPDQWKKVGGEIGQKEVEMIVDAIKGDQDGQEDWARWKDEVLFKDMIAQEGLENVHVPGPNGRSSRPSDELLKRALQKLEQDNGSVPAKGLNRPADIETAWQKRVREQSSDFCPECKIPLLPDPKPEELYIYLHAIKYWTDEWSFEDVLPWWAREDWQSITPHSSCFSSNTTNGKGLAEANIPEELAGLTIKTERQLASSSAISSLITSEIEEKASRLADPHKHFAPDLGIELTKVRQLGDYPPVLSERSSSVATGLLTKVVGKVDVPVVFQVFGGFEDFASREILSQALALLPYHSDPHAGTSSSIHSGHVVVSDPCLATHSLEAYFNAKLGIAKTAYLLVASEEFPRDLAKELKHDKYVGGASKRAKWKAKELRKALAKKEGRRKVGTQKTNAGIIDKPVILRDEGVRKEPEIAASQVAGQAASSRTDLQTNAENETEADEGAPFPSEEKLLRLLDTIWERSRSQLDSAVAIWNGIYTSITGEQLLPSQRTYRASVDRATYNLPSLNSQIMERYVGELAWDYLNGRDTHLDAPTNWKVDLEQPVLDITLKFFPGFGIGDEFEQELSSTDDPTLKSEGRIAYMLKLSNPCVPFPRRPAGRNELLVGGTAMAEYRAASLALALPIPVERTVKDGTKVDSTSPVRILEPCCGHGILVFETAAMMEARGITGDIFGCDVDDLVVNRAKQISTLAGFSPNDSGKVKVHLRDLDATDRSSLEAFVGGKGSMDAIITDLPWGKREKASQSLSKLYHFLLESWYGVLRTGGYIVTVTAEHKTLSRALSVFETNCRKKRSGSCLVMEDVRMLQVEGQDGVRGWEDEKVKKQGVLEAKRNDRMRKIEIGYHVYVFLIRKVAIQ